MLASGPVAFLKPFRALRYDPERAGPLDRLVAPPHDVVGDELHERLLAESPWNAVRLVRPDTPEEAARALEEWQASGLLVREDRPAVWLLEQSFAGPDGVERTRRGLVARVRLEPYTSGRILPHERTFERSKSKRLALLEATRTKLSPIFLLHEGGAPPEAEGPPLMTAELDGSRSSLWRIDDPDAVEEALAAVRGRLVIADGHHRYESARLFNEREGSDETAHVLAVLVARDDPGLVIFPTHRLAAAPPQLNGSLRQTPLAGIGEGLDRLSRLPRDRGAFVVVEPGRTLLAEREPTGDPLEDLDTTAVGRVARGELAFTPFADEAEAAVRSGRAAAAFLVRPPTFEQIEAVALAGETMPEKSTYFFPKLLSGLLFSPLDE
jgi:uncharacterized protein (DUF1015 family)